MRHCFVYSCAWMVDCGQYVIMVTKCAINGFGHIGRLVFKYAWEDPTLEIGHGNNVCSCESAAYLAQFDSVHGTWGKTIECSKDGKGVTVDGKTVSFLSESDFTKVDWKGMGIEVVMECTGRFLKVKTLSPYLDNCGVKQVVVSAPVKEEGDLNIVIGCKHQRLKEKTHRIITTASCTTNWQRHYLLALVNVKGALDVHLHVRVVLFQFHTNMTCPLCNHNKKEERILSAQSKTRHP